QPQRTGRYMGKRPVPARALAKPSNKSGLNTRAAIRDDYAWHVPDNAPWANSKPIEVNSVTNIVFMGMGEPLVNYTHLWSAIHTLNSPQGLGLGARRMTVSTVGVVPT